MTRNTWLIAILSLTCAVTLSLLTPDFGHAQPDSRVQKSMERLNPLSAQLRSDFRPHLR
jgi:hypothetical protein